ncbi:MAG: helix-turn-helix domain-containing protein [Euryarchaeota archaeon]|nr:helix-turn-helix domain-containing protein [Euryarchaeota archaeon]
MQRLVIDLPLSTMEALGYAPLLRQVELLSVYILRSDRNTVTQVIRVRPRSPEVKVEELLASPLVGPGSRLLRTEGDTWVALVTLRATRAMRQLIKPFPDILLDHPIEVRRDRLRITLVGEGTSLHRLVELAKASGFQFEAVRFETVDVGPTSPMGALTAKQQSVLRAAYEMGYFENPKRVRLQELAKLFGQDKSTVMETLRRAQRNLLGAVLR